MNIIYFTIILSLASLPVLSQELVDLGYHHTIVNVHPINADSILITSNGGDFHASLFSLKRKGVIKEIIRNGRGPSEAIRIESSTVEQNEEGNYLYVKDSDRSIIKYDLKQSDTMKESMTKLTSITHMQVYEDELVLSKKLVIFPQQLSKYRMLDIGYIVNKNDFSIKDTLHLSVDYLGLDNLKSVNRLDRSTYIGLHTFVIQLSSNEYIIGLNGLNKIFYMKKGEVKEIVELNIPNSFKIEVKMHEAFGYGIRFPGIINNISSIDIRNQKVSFSFGNIVLGIPYGVVTLSKKNIGFKTSYNYISSINYYLSSNAMITNFTSGYLIYDSMRIRTSNLYQYK